MRPGADLPGTAAEVAARDAQLCASQGVMDFAELITRASELERAGYPALAAQLYTTWLGHHASKLAHVGYFNLGTIWAAQGELDAAQMAYLEAIRLQPGFVQPRLNLADVLERAGRVEEAMAQWAWVRAAVSPHSVTNRPLLCMALNHMGRVLEQQQRLAQALQCLHESLLLEPDQPQVVQHWIALRQQLCIWPVYAPFGQVTVADMVRATSAMSMLALTDDPQAQQAAAQRFVDHALAQHVPTAPWKSNCENARLRVAYCSSDFCQHPVAMLCAELFELHDRQRFEVFVYCWSPEDGSALRQRVLRAVDHVVPIDQLSDAQAAQRMRADAIDIVVDLQGQTAGARPQMLAMRPAPVQIGFLGYPGTSCIPGVDYLLADAYVLPPGQTAFFAERPIYMPKVFQVSDRMRQSGPVPSRTDVGLPADAFVFACFNRADKLTPEIFAAWMRILQRVPHAVLCLLCDQAEVRENLRAQASEMHISVDKLIFIRRLEHVNYLAHIPLADVFLDTFPFNGGASANDVLWMGVPLLTLCGRSFAARMAASLLHAAHLDALITHTLKDYENAAVDLALQPDRLAAVRAALASVRQDGGIFDTSQWVRDWESQLQTLA
jgi:predicted O-linked N-acetylglucosamine transferase (SPINDLY family)